MEFAWALSMEFSTTMFEKVRLNYPVMMGPRQNYSMIYANSQMI